MAEVLALACYAEDRWLSAQAGADLVSAIDGAVVATTPRQAADADAMLTHARRVGGPSLRRLTFAERGRMLRKLAEALTERKQELYELSYATGATHSDSAFDIEGGIGVLFSYASKAKALPEAHILFDGEREAISKGNFAGQHILTPLQGAAVHINAFNFPVWGLLEKAAPALLAGAPIIVKPATVTAWLAAAAFRIMQESGLLPPGAMQLHIGPPGNLLTLLGEQDSVAFTGSAETAAQLRALPNIVARAVRFNAEQDSLNASVLGPEATPDAPEFGLFVKEAVREMTQKAGQKCTAIRRIFAPEHLMESVETAIAARLASVAIGDPRDKNVRMGALAGLAQRADVQAKLAMLRAETRLVAGGQLHGLIGAHPDKGAFLAPHLLRCDEPRSAKRIHSIEAFGPVATLAPYRDVDDVVHLAQAGKGSLVMSAFSHDQTFLRELVLQTASSHGRLLLVDRDNAADSTGHGAAMPQLLHGGPGRAGGGAELGGMIGVAHYMQRTAIQAAPATLDALAAT